MEDFNKINKKHLKNLTTLERLHLHALEAYLKKGAHNTTFQSLADDLGVSQAALYKYYRSKDELLVGAISYAAEKGRDYLLWGESLNDLALNRFYYHIKRNLLFCQRQRIYAVAVITLHYFSICVPGVKELHREINMTRINRIGTYLHHAKNENSIGDIDIGEASELIHSALLGEMIKCYIFFDEIDIERRMDYLWKEISRIISAESCCEIGSL